jgi:hypothetical protein
MRFETPELQKLLRDVTSCSFTTNAAGVLQMPGELDNRIVTIGNTVYRLGIGGLHSSETCANWHADTEHQLIDIDATSYYPSIILEQGLFPPQCGPAFLDAYREIVNRRIHAKRTGDKVTADSLKIVVNGSFGKLGSAYSRLYAPDLFKQVTVTGQLALLMLIEHLEAEGIPVISANTDGIVVRPHMIKLPVLDGIVALWELLTGYETERAFYSSMYSRDVNSYVAIKSDGSVKTKGIFAHEGLSKNPTMPIIYAAVIQYLRTGQPIDAFIRQADCIKDFLTVRTVKGGGMWRGQYLGKVVRWYWSTQGESIRYASNGNKVATSDGARPVMHMLDDMPTDIDYRRYIHAAHVVLNGIGVIDIGNHSVWEVA